MRRLVGEWVGVGTASCIVGVKLAGRLAGRLAGLLAGWLPRPADPRQFFPVH